MKGHCRRQLTHDKCPTKPDSACPAGDVEAHRAKHLPEIHAESHTDNELEGSASTQKCLWILPVDHYRCRVA